ncbi:MAG: TIGR00153 family protein [Proteobacteria bacterium]|nr:TIGR00153 family protein [Pseudomonadota bacterium]MBU1737945.1 TIGR00153 family protein [Pseudomonadota bacterium]
MSIIQELFSGSPFGPLVEHTKKVHECVEVLKPLMEALAHENHEELHRLQDKISKLEYEADLFKQEIRSRLPRRFFLPVDRSEIDNFLRCQDKIADRVQDLAVILTIRKTRIHPDLIDGFFEFVEQIFQVTGLLLTAAVELNSLAEVSFGGAESKEVLKYIEKLGEEEWKADRMARKLSKGIYSLEKELNPIDIIFYEKILLALGSIANEAENAGDMLRMMIVK